MLAFVHRFYLPPAQTGGATLHLPEPEAHHAARVLRLEPGDPVTVLDGCGQELRCTLTEIGRRSATLEVRERHHSPPPGARVTLVQALPKGKSFELILQKATELGAARIVPLVTERVVTQLDDDQTAAKVEKWRHIAIEALKQCGSPWLPEILRPLTPQGFIAAGETFDLAFVGALNGERAQPRTWLDRYVAQHQTPPRRVSVWIGPEGDFTPTELDLIKAAGALPITLGPQILRVETAAIYGLSVLSYELQCRAVIAPA